MDLRANHHQQDRLKLGGMLIALGIVFGDIGTSPLYVMKALVDENGGLEGVSEPFLLGCISLVFWSLTLLTTLKYVIIALRADNNGEGGILSLYALVRKRGRWLIVPAMIGGAALLADGVLTPAVTVTSAVEGLRDIPWFVTNFGTDQQVIVLITISIISALFLVQRFGTSGIGKAFGPIMVVWFVTIFVAGFANFIQNPSILRALSPHYALLLLASPQNKMGIFILGSVFLATTGAEALYSDMGHVGRRNIYVTWPLIKVSLIMSYLGQAAWLLNAKANPAIDYSGDFNPFYLMVPPEYRIFLVVIATFAAIIASQALITGSYTLVSEAIHLKMLPRLVVRYPSDSKGQMYIPSVNHMLWIACIAVICYFRSSVQMKSAYGLAITVTMLMTTILLYQYLRMKKVSPVLSASMLAFFGALELSFFVSSAAKFFKGGFIAALLAACIYFLMYIWTKGSQIRDKARRSVPLAEYKQMLLELKRDESVPQFACNLIYLTPVMADMNVDNKIMSSIFDGRPKRADVYWFITVEVTDDPYTAKYHVEDFGTDYMFKIHLYLGFKMEYRLSSYVRQILSDMMQSGQVRPQMPKYTTIAGRQAGDVTFVMLKQALMRDAQMQGFEKWVLDTKLRIKRFTDKPERWFGIEPTEATPEIMPMIIGEQSEHILEQI